jgi:hypothetical protein
MQRLIYVLFHREGPRRGADPVDRSTVVHWRLGDDVKRSSLPGSSRQRNVAILFEFHRGCFAGRWNPRHLGNDEESTVGGSEGRAAQRATGASSVSVTCIKLSAYRSVVGNPLLRNTASMRAFSGST